MVMEARVTLILVFMNHPAIAIAMNSLRWFVTAYPSAVPERMIQICGMANESAELVTDRLVEEVRGLNDLEFEEMCGAIKGSDRQFFGALKGGELIDFLRGIRGT
jgi:hypothetical protein